MRVSGIPYVQGRNSYSDADGTKYGIAIHNTSNDASDENEASFATRRTDGVSSHFYVDGDSVTQSLDTAARAGHAGSSNGNQNAVAVEIRGVNAWTRQQWLDSVCWDLLGRVLAQVCQHYGIAVRRATVAEMQANPKVRAFYSHDDMRRAWGGTDHTDPGPGFPWDRLFAAVQAAIGGATVATTGADDMSNSWTFVNQPSDEQWRISQNAGWDYLNGQARDTVLAIAAARSADASSGVQQLIAAAAADEVRDKAAVAAIQALTAAIQSGGGSIDAAPIVAAVRAVGDQVHADVVQLQQQLAAERGRSQQLAAALAAAGAGLQAADDPAA